MTKKVRMTEVFQIKEAIPAAGGSGHSWDILGKRKGKDVFKDPFKKGPRSGRSDFDDKSEFSRMTAHADMTADDMLAMNDNPDEYEQHEIVDMRGKSLADPKYSDVFQAAAENNMAHTQKLKDGNYYIQTDAHTFGVTGFIIDQEQFDELSQGPVLQGKMARAMQYSKP